MKNIQAQALIVAVVSVLYTLSFWLMEVVVVPLQTLISPSLTDYALLIFLPHGVRVLTAWLFGWRSVLYLLAAAVVGHFVVTPDVAITISKALTWLVGAASGWLGISALRLLGVPLGPDLDLIGRDTWRYLIFAGIVASLFNSIGHGLVYQTEIFSELLRPMLFAFVFGDTMGTILCFGLALGLFRARHLFGRP